MKKLINKLIFWINRPTARRKGDFIIRWDLACRKVWREFAKSDETAKDFKRLQRKLARLNRVIEKETIKRSQQRCTA